jgi:hypothetical protein
LKHSIWTRNYFSTIFASSRIYSKVEKGFLKKKVRAGIKLAWAAPHRASPFQSGSAREAGGHTPDGRGPPIRCTRWPKRYGRHWAVRSSSDRRSTVIVLLSLPRDRPKTLAWLGGHGGSPREILRHRRGHEKRRRSTVSPTMGGTVGCISRTMTCTSVTTGLDSVLQGVDESAFLGQEEGQVW